MENKIVINGKVYKIVGEAKTVDGSLMQEIEPLSDNDILIDKIEKNRKQTKRYIHYITEDE